MLRIRFGDDRGTAMVEFAIGAMILFLLILMIMQAALMFQGWLAVTQGSREAARAGALCIGRKPGYNCTNDDVRTWAMNAAAGVNPDQLLDPQVDLVDTGDGKMLSVTFQYQVVGIAPLVDAFIPDGFTLSATSEMRLEGQ